ncbi:uncharacterized protein LOC142814497 [Rhipicephalus microplus]|uniref:uncharacterized protein LOC142814497 n=1 Tax=Rhipicephalus microplus TaxID=6941 RepID=UPI003F6BF2A1
MLVRSLIVAVLVSCHGAKNGVHIVSAGQIDEVRQQGINQAYNGADVELCEQAGHGYHADVASNCRRYHLCEKTANGTWLLRRLTCPPGTSFDDAKDECSSRNPSCSLTDGSASAINLDEVEQVSAAATTSIPTSPSPLDAAEQIVTDVADVVAEKENAPADGNHVPASHAMCPTNFGYFPHIESECRKYYACVRFGQSTVVKHVFDCPRDKRFDSVKMLCVDASQAPACQFAPAAKYHDITYDEEEIFNTTSLPAGNDYGLVGLLPVNLTVDALDHMMARLIMSYMQSGKNITQGELTAVQKILSETHPVPLTVLATVKLVSSTFQKVPNASELMDMLSIMNDEHGKFFGPAFLERSRSVVRNLTSLVERYGAIRALSAATSYNRLKNAYETVQDSWFVLRNRTAPFFYSGEDNGPADDPNYIVASMFVPSEPYLDQAPSRQDYMVHKLIDDVSDEPTAVVADVNAKVSATNVGSPDGTNIPAQALSKSSVRLNHQHSVEAVAPSSMDIRRVGSNAQAHEEQSLSSDRPSESRQAPVKQVMLHGNHVGDYIGSGPERQEVTYTNMHPHLFVHDNENYEDYDYFGDIEDEYFVPDLGSRHEDLAMMLHA